MATQSQSRARTSNSPEGASSAMLCVMERMKPSMKASGPMAKTRERNMPAKSDKAIAGMRSSGRSTVKR